MKLSDLTENPVIIKLSKGDINKQLGVAQEEAAELIVAISKMKRNKKDSYDNCIEEIADMTIMMSQLFRVFDEKKILLKIDEKLARCERRIIDGEL